MKASEDFLEKAKQEGRALLGQETKDKVFSSQHLFPDPDSARRAFVQSVAKLFRVDDWSDLPGISSTFELHDHQGQRKKDGRPVVGDYVRIVLPGPLPENWVSVTDIKEEEQGAAFTVRPSENPKNPQGEKTEHFFSSEATSTFRVEWEGNTITAYEIGRNERVNNQGEEAGGRGIVNTLIAGAGWAGIQDMQWNKLTRYLVHLEGEED
jgi:hypothetical protein